MPWVCRHHALFLSHRQLATAIHLHVGSYAQTAGTAKAHYQNSLRLGPSPAPTCQADLVAAFSATSLADVLHQSSSQIYLPGGQARPPSDLFS
ncbi:hypothetical protein B0J12DRAFT_327757 [Macrophomina phaseolina]|uniref:Uncharacterized protein n=1 Tax=Macrophomina phaseolina TaxID=35725 RepID=A0ABQ8FVM1_9PEZI|nr:hypothetical protein B0J12DRAFT_327757 [Macrophomina phaseolina]